MFHESMNGMATHNHVYVEKESKLITIKIQQCTENKKPKTSHEFWWLQRWPNQNRTACNNGWTVDGVLSCLHANRQRRELPLPVSSWEIPGSLGVLGIEEVGVGPLKSAFFLTEGSNKLYNKWIILVDGINVWQTLHVLYFYKFGVKFHLIWPFNLIFCQ